MSADWNRVRAVLESALEHDAESRRDFVEKACRGDEALRAEVTSLLSGIESDPGFLEVSQNGFIGLSPEPPLSSASGPVLGEGAVLGTRYEILQLLGEGGMGTVYKARDRELDRFVALKVIRPDLAGNPEVIRRFKQELVLASQVTHRNVIRIFDLGVEDNFKFITMDFVEGKDLRSVLAEERKFPANQACEIVRQICLGLEAAHNVGVVHRDLKPQNIMLDAQGRVYLMDFGLARSMDLVGMTRTGALLGTPAYMSPEQAKGEKVDARTDLFSLGVILYEMLTAILPYRADSMMATLIQRSKEAATPPIQLEPSIPPGINHVVMKCLQIDPAHRYQQARDILEDLDPARELLSDPAVPRQRSNLAWRWTIAEVLILVALVSAVPKTRRAFFAWTGATAKITTAPSRARTYIAVLPFRILGGEASPDYAADGMSEALSADLSRLKDLHLASQAAVVKVNTKDPIPQIARSLGVQRVVQGSVQSNRDRIIIAVSLDDPSTGRIWSQEFSGLKQDLLTLQDQVYAALVSALHLKLTKEDLAKSTIHLTRDTGAYQDYVKGRTLLRVAEHDEPSLRQALSRFEEATQKDPSFTIAYTGIADTCRYLYDLKKDGAWSVRALGAANRAQSLNDSVPEVHFALGSVYSEMGRTEEAVAELKRALELDPNSDDGYLRLGRTYLDMGQKTEALSAFERAVEANPYYPANYSMLGAGYLQLLDDDRAMKAFHRVTQLDPDNSTGWTSLGAVALREGKWNDAIAAFGKALELEQSAEKYSDLGTSYFFLGKYDEARANFAKAVELNSTQAVFTGELADAYRQLGQSEKARATYDRAILLADRLYKTNPRDAAALSYLGVYYAKEGSSIRGLEFARRARAVDPDDAGFLYREAVVDTLANRMQEALQSLQKALSKGYSLSEVLSDPELSSLRQQPAFKAIATSLQSKPNP